MWPRSIGLLSLAAALVLAALASAPRAAWAEAELSRFSAGGYLRLAARPDFQGGEGKLGYWNLYGRLLNEGPWGALELKLDLVPPRMDSNDVWAAVQARIEGGTFANTDLEQGRLGDFRISQVFVQAGNVLLENVIWQIGTQLYFFGDLGLYDMRPASLFLDMVGVSARYRHKYFDLLVAVGDSGFGMRGFNYNTVLSGGAAARLKLGVFELGGGAEVRFEPSVPGNRNAPLTTPIASYEDFYRRRVVAVYDLENPHQLPRMPVPQGSDSLSYVAVGYLGFGNFGPVIWNNLFVRYELRHPENFYTESHQGRSYDIFIRDFTDERTALTIGNELSLRLIPNWLDLTAAFLFGLDRDGDNTIAASEADRMYYSGVARVQLYLTDNLHVLVENSLAREESLQGNLWRTHYDSVFASTGGQANTQGLEFGDTAQRDTWQFKAGLVINPSGMGIFTRPSLRILYGLQLSNVHNAFGNNFSSSLEQFDLFQETEDRHLHQVVAIEAETWF